MLRPKTIIKLTQQPSAAFPNRKAEITFDFVNHYEFSDTWENLSSTGKVVLPKKINAIDKYNKPFPLFGTNKNIGGFTSTPTILRGDKITIDAAYDYWDKDLNIIEPGYNRIMEGFVSKVMSGQPIEFDIENNMWLLKQIPASNYNYQASLEDNLNTWLQGTGLTVNMITSTSITFDTGKLVTNENETIAQFLMRLRRDYFLESYFRGSELRVGSLVYIEAEAVEREFAFQDNIFDNPDLEYSRKDDLVLSAVASTSINELSGTTKDGATKTKRKRIDVFVSIKNDKETIKVLSDGEQAPENLEGERLTLKYPWCTTATQLANEALNTLRKGYFTGFKGSFTTFGTPFVKHGDNIRLVSPVLPEQDGLYKCKGVEYVGGVEGMQQTIKLHYKI